MRHGTVEEIVYEVKDESPVQNNIYTSRSSNRFPAQQVSSRVVQFNRSSSPKISFNISSQPRPVASNPPPPPPPPQPVSQFQAPPPAPLTTHNNKDLLSLKSMTTVTALRNESNPS